MAACWCSKTCASIPEEEKNGEAFSKQLSQLCDGLFVCDAFGSAHRAHASVVGITKFVKQAAAGLLMEKELAYIGKAITNPARPFVAIIGGAKVSDKIEVVENLMKIADAMLIGGGMAYTFEKAQGLQIGKSLVEDDKLELAKRLLADAKAKNFKLLLPTDHVVAPEFKADAPATICDVTATPADQMGLDIGPKTIAAYSAEIAKAKTIVWNGPMGVFEMPAFAKGTLEIAKAVAAATEAGAISIVGGGDSVAAVHQSGVGEAGFAHLHRRRRFARIPRRRKTPRRRGAHQQMTFASITAAHFAYLTIRGLHEPPSPRHGRQLEDVQNAGRDPRLLLGLHARRRQLHPRRHRDRAALHRDLDRG